MRTRSQFIDHCDCGYTWDKMMANAKESIDYRCPRCRSIHTAWRTGADAAHGATADKTHAEDA